MIKITIRPILVRGEIIGFEKQWEIAGLILYKRIIKHPMAF